MGETLGRAEFFRNIDVSRETMARLDTYAALLRKWSPKINLVSDTTLPNLWTRHFLDSAQLYNIAGCTDGHWVDIGSGGGFPGLVVAVIAAQLAPDMLFTLVESDRRKVVFLQTVVQNLSLESTILAERAENIETLGADIISARAVARLNVLVGYANKHLKPSGTALIMKGESFGPEVDEALENWSFQSDEYTSITNGAAVILKLGDIRRV